MTTHDHAHRGIDNFCTNAILVLNFSTEVGIPGCIGQFIKLGIAILGQFCSGYACGAEQSQGDNVIETGNVENGTTGWAINDCWRAITEFGVDKVNIRVWRLNNMRVR